MYNLHIILVVVVIIYMILIIIVFGSYYVIVKYPHSKLSAWIRRHIITDEDLEQF
jgi:hypothetical protein